MKSWSGDANFKSAFTVPKKWKYLCLLVLESQCYVEQTNQQHTSGVGVSQGEFCKTKKKI